MPPPIPPCRCSDLERQLSKAKHAVASQQAVQAAAAAADGQEKLTLALRAAEERAAAADAVALDAQQHAEVGGKGVACAWLCHAITAWLLVVALLHSRACISFPPPPASSFSPWLPTPPVLPAQAVQKLVDRLVEENDALADHLNQQALELASLRSAMTAAARFAQAADEDAQHAEAAAAAAVGYLPPASPMRQLSGGINRINRQLSDTSAAVAMAAGLPSPGRPASAASGAPPSPRPGGFTPSVGGTPRAGAGAEALSEQQVQLLAQAEELERLRLELERQRGRNVALESQVLQQQQQQQVAVKQQQQQAPPQRTGSGSGSDSGVLAANGRASGAAGGGRKGLPTPATHPRPKAGYSFWSWIAGSDIADAATA